MKTIGVAVFFAAVMFGTTAGGGDAKPMSACDRAFQPLVPMMNKLVADAKTMDQLPPIPYPPGKPVPNFYLRHSCPVWAHYDFKSLLSEAADMQARTRKASRKCPARDAARMVALVDIIPRALDDRIDTAKKICAASGYKW